MKCDCKYHGMALIPAHVTDAPIPWPSTELELSRSPPEAPETAGQQERDPEQDRHEHLHDVKVQRIARDEQRGDGSRKYEEDAKDQTHGFPAATWCDLIPS